MDIRLSHVAIIVGLMLSGVLAVAQSSAGSAPTADEITRIVTVEALALSPDAHQVATILGRESWRDGFEVRELWLVHAGGKSEARRLLPPDDQVTSVAWQPKGNKLAVIAQRRAPAQSRRIALLDPATGAETVLKTDVPGADDLQWSPDGRWLAFVWRGAPLAPRAKGAPVMLGEPPKPARVWQLNLDRQSCEAVTPPGFSVAKFAWGPRSDAFVIAARRTDEWLAPRDRILVVRPGSDARELFAAHDMSISLSWSPDGRTIAWCGREHEPDSGQLMIASADGNERPRTVQADLPASVVWMEHREDGRIAFAAIEGLRVGLWSIDGAGDDLRLELAPGKAAPGSLGAGSFSNFALSFSADGTAFAAPISGPAEPANVAVGKWGGESQRITDLNPAVRGWKLGTHEDVSWRSSDGLEVQGILVRPPGFDPRKRYPLLVELHGGPRRSWWATALLTDIAWAGYLSSRGYLVLLPNPRGSEGRGAKFVRANTRDFGGGDFRDVMAGVDAIIARGCVDESKMGVLGWSYGGYLASWTITQTTRFQAAVVGAGIVNLISREGASTAPGFWNRVHWLDDRVVWNEPSVLAERSPVYHAGKVRTPTLIIHGLDDMNVPPSQAREFYGALRAHDVPVEARLYPGEGHTLFDPLHRADTLRRIESWLGRYLGTVKEGPL